MPFGVDVVALSKTMVLTPVNWYAEPAELVWAVWYPSISFVLAKDPVQPETRAVAGADPAVHLRPARESRSTRCTPSCTALQSQFFVKCLPNACYICQIVAASSCRVPCGRSGGVDNVLDNAVKNALMGSHRFVNAGLRVGYEAAAVENGLNGPEEEEER